MRIILEDTDIKNQNVTGYKRIVAGPLADTQGAPQGPPEIQNVTHGKMSGHMTVTPRVEPFSSFESGHQCLTSFSAYTSLPIRLHCYYASP